MKMVSYARAAKLLCGFATSVALLTSATPIRAQEVPPEPEVIAHIGGLVNFNVNASNGQVTASGMPSMWLEFPLADPGVDNMDSSEFYIRLSINGVRVGPNSYYDTRQYDPEVEESFLFSTDENSPSLFPFSFSHVLPSGQHTVSLAVGYHAPPGMTGWQEYVFFNETVTVNVP